MRTLFDRDPLACKHALREVEGHVFCDLRGGVWTNCREGLAGEAPHCSYEPPDNSSEAMERRREWIERNTHER